VKKYKDAIGVALRHVFKPSRTNRSHKQKRNPIVPSFTISHTILHSLTLNMHNQKKEEKSGLLGMMHVCCMRKITIGSPVFDN
jgi:hypothetical protein